MDTTTAPHRRRRAIVAGGVLATALVAGAAASHSDAGPNDRRVCTFRPIADDMSNGPALVGTIRMKDGVTQVLHRMRCSDGSFRDVWLAPAG